MRFVFFLILCLLLARCGSEPEPAPINLPKVDAYMLDPEAIARGQALFIGSCSQFCHTLTPEDTDASFLFDCQWKHGSTNEDIFRITTSGVPGTRMVGFGSNFPEGDDDLWKIIAYIRTNQDNCGEPTVEVSEEFQ